MESFLENMRSAKISTSITANTQPMKDLTRTQHLNLYRHAFANMLTQLERGGYDVREYRAMSKEDIDARIETELFSMRYETYNATPSQLDIFAVPLHRVRSPEEKEVSKFGREPSSSLEWRQRWKEFIHWEVDTEDEMPPRVYVHFACFPENTVFKEKHMLAVTNNLQEIRGLSPRDTIVVVIQNVPSKTLRSRKIYQNYVNDVMNQREANFIILMQLSELQFQLEESKFVPPARVIHCRRELDFKLKAKAHIEKIEEELPEIDVDDPQAVRLFARPRQVIECMLCSENELDSTAYYVVHYPQLNF